MPTRVRLVSDRAGQNWILLTLCLAVFVVNVSTTIVNIALPSLVTELDASTRDLLWIVDAFNLAFAALVLAAGSLSDRFGRRRALLLGLALFAAASLIGAWSSDPGTLIAWRTVAGVAAAVVYPVTLSILSNVFTDRRERVRAIGIWGAATGLSVAIGPVVGGALLEHYWWGSILLFNGAAAVLTLVLALRLVPDSRDPSTPPLDVLGLVLSTLALGTFVYTIIEAPDHGWASTRSLVGFGVAAALLVVFVLQEIRVEHPMLDVRLFSNLRFTAASGAVTGAFFALFGFLFLVTQYFQSLRDYGALETGLRMLPVAGSLAVAALIGPAVAMRFGSKLIVALGLLSMTVAFGWASFTTITTPYGVIVAIMVFLGAGIGLTSAPATEAIMGVVSPDKAGMGSAVNDATREIGGTLGVAILGTVALTTYRNSLDDTMIPGQLLEPARASIGAAVEVASRASLLGDEARAAGEKLLDVARLGFMDGFSASCVVAACTTLVAAVLTLVYLPAHPEHTALESELEAAQKIQRIRASGRTSR